MTFQLNEEQKKYSFLDQESNQEFYLDLHNDEPIKLGDGTFGIVFAASTSNRPDKKLAVKILYEYSTPGINKENIEVTPNSIETRFNNEIQSTKKIVEFSENTEDSKTTHIIEVLGWTREFQQSNLYQELKNKFNSLKLSNYALVTEKYDHTLKTLLEGGIELWTYPGNESEPSNSREELEEKIQKEKNIYELRGYDILRQKTFEDRIATILPYLLDIAEGLKTLHKAGLYHLDLKPANIFVKKYGNNVQSVIGDLGFLYPGENPPFEALPVANLQLPLGTRHYRSPEQKDYFDICDVDVEVCNSTLENDQINCHVKLITYDPKLRDTIIEKDDYIVFSKNKKAYPIQSIEIDHKSENSPIYITLQTTINDLSNDKKTQVILYKRQEERTDLFGFGAIVYDLLTCGESPERFYENIRLIYDQEGKNVDDIMEDYLKVSDFQSTEPSLVQVFEPFKLNKTSSSYAPSDIVKIILQCMLYKAENTFYSVSKSDQDQKAAEMLHNSLLNLTETNGRGGKYKVEIIENHLLLRRWNSAKHSNNPGFLDTIQMLQNIENNNLWKRFAEGVWYLEKISRLVEDLLKPNQFSFSELLPINFAISQKSITGEPDSLNIKFNLYKTKDSYERDLRSDFVYTKITRDIGNPFVPNYLTFMRRKIRLITDSENNNIIYQFLDSSPYGDVIEEHDWIILKSKNNDHSLLQIEEIGENSHTVLKYRVVSADQDAKDIDIKKNISSDKEYVYYKYIDPCKYYFNMIGIYIYQIFFVSIDNQGQSKPYITDIINNEINKIKIKDFNSKAEIIIEEISEPNKIERLVSGSKGFKSEHFEKILKIIVSIYLKLTFHESQQSYYARGDNYKSKMKLLFDDIKQIRTEIENASNIDIGKYPEGPFDPFKEELQRSLKTFDKLTLDMIKVQKK
ncbi:MULTISPECIES: protein kinase [unclassified Anabaena]|uniref:protein kinase domain-containing protein n=1 Tax=unclassified Anabaena TaxID=2619674 RepID=UPI001446B20A|nr:MULTISPECIES: protein kinase [unclassified Anabaena]MTJ07105.1 protein kinase [Anabaena sp. UHCC 0204]MTJ51979.1 protein kinase [Anabaena sp. UHCC 0253]